MDVSSGDLGDPDSTLNDTVFSVYPIQPETVTVGNEVNKPGASGCRSVHGRTDSVPSLLCVEKFMNWYTEALVCACS